MGNTEQAPPSKARQSDDADPLSDIVTKEEVAAKLGVHTSTLLRWDNLGIGPPRTKIGRMIRYSRQQVAEFMKAKALVDAQKRNRRGAR